MKGLILALGLSLLLVPSGVKADKLTDPYIPKIKSGDILPPQYIGTDNKPIKDKIPSKEEWIKSVEGQKNGGENKVIKIDSKKKNFKIKKVNKKGEPIQGTVFEVFNTKADADKGQNAVKTITSDEKGNVDLDTVSYYGFYVKEKSVPSPYVVKEDIVSFYRDNGVRFLGEMTPTQLKPSEAKDGQNLNTYLQSLTSAGSNFNASTNWLVFNDNGKEKLIAKKPIKYYISWDSLKDAGLVFGQKEKPADYTPTEITVNGKKYIVRLIRAYNDKVDINNHPTWSYRSSDHYNATKGSEWNRLILPLINPTGDDNNTGYANGKNGRYGSNTKGFVESNMPILANYSWWTDFGGSNDSLGKYNSSDYYGARRWAQEIGYDGPSYRAYRGSGYNYYGAGYAYSNYPYNYGNYRGWLPVLELIN